MFKAAKIVALALYLVLSFFLFCFLDEVVDLPNGLLESSKVRSIWIKFVSGLY